MWLEMFVSFIEELVRGIIFYSYPLSHMHDSVYRLFCSWASWLMWFYTHNNTVAWFANKTEERNEEEQFDSSRLISFGEFSNRNRLP